MEINTKLLLAELIKQLPGQAMCKEIIVEEKEILPQMKEIIED